MGKDFKEKYEKVCGIKDKALNLVEMQLNGNLEQVNASELGDVADIGKDMAETIYYMAAAEYYYTITEAMEKNSDPENQMYMEKYLPESRKYYTRPLDYDKMYDPRWDDDFRKRMYYTEPNMNYANGNGNTNTSNPGNGDSRSNMNSGMRDSREGRSGMTRKMYMENKDNPDANVKMQNLESYMHDLTDDVMEMMQGMDSNSKAHLKQKLTTLASKIA